MKVLALIIALALLGDAAHRCGTTARHHAPHWVPLERFAGLDVPISWRAFRHGLHERGYVEGTHFIIESRYAEGNPARLPGLAAELVGLPVAVIVTDRVTGHPGGQAGDQHDSGCDGGQRRPGGDGRCHQPGAPGREPDRAEPLGPGVKWETTGAAQRSRASDRARSGAGEPGQSQHRRAAARDAARSPGRCRCSCTWSRCAARRSWTTPSQPSAVCRRTRSSGSSWEPLFMQQRARLVELTTTSRLPAMYGFREDVEMGALMADGPNLPDMFRRCRHLRRQDSEGCQAWRPPRGAADEV